MTNPTQRQGLHTQKDSHAKPPAPHPHRHSAHVRRLLAPPPRRTSPHRKGNELSPHRTHASWRHTPRLPRRSGTLGTQAPGTSLSMEAPARARLTMAAHHSAAHHSAEHSLVWSPHGHKARQYQYVPVAASASASYGTSAESAPVCFHSRLTLRRSEGASPANASADTTAMSSGRLRPAEDECP